MSIGYSLHIGLNLADPKHYPGIPILVAAVQDAKDWNLFAEKKGYKAKTLLDRQATVKAVTKALSDYAGKMRSGDILLLTYSGHGGEIPNSKPAEFDDEQNDQTWCLYDRQFLDDEIFECLKQFDKGTRITVVSDSCHSGTVTRVLGEIDLSEMLARGIAAEAGRGGVRSRKLSSEVASKNFVLQEDTYRGVQKRFETTRQAEGVNASVKLLAACQDDEETLDGERNGLFTGTLLTLLNQYDYTSSTAERLIAAVSAQYHFPRPNFFQYGSIIKSYDLGSPFDIKIPSAGVVTGNRPPNLGAAQLPPLQSTHANPWDTLKSNYPARIVIESKRKIDVLASSKDVTVVSTTRAGTRFRVIADVNNIPAENAWTAVHAIKTQLRIMDPANDFVVEPLLSLNPAQKARITREGDANNPDYIREWPPSLLQGKPDAKLGWHLDDKHSQLTKACEAVLDANKDAYVRVGHFDTGYIDKHPALPDKLNRKLARTFIENENINTAIDKPESGQDGHGLGTITLLAGNKVEKALTFDEYEGYVGGIPFADVVPIRISESVVILNTQNFCDAIDYAIEQQCEVVTMSMAGKPSMRMADAVNKAYEAGIVLVTAASNCWYKGLGAVLPKCVMFPAAFERVIAATGALYDHRPYDVDYLQQARVNIGTQYMQGCWGPPSRMKKALAGYTPNVPWASTRIPFLRSGGGTSSATPQVAAAGALWIAYHRKTLEAKGFYQPGNGWRKVEAVRKALFISAAKDSVFPYWEKYYGNGIVRAYDALQVEVPDPSTLKKSPKASSSLFGLLETVGAFFSNRKLFRGKAIRPDANDLAMELLDLIQTDPVFAAEFSSLDLGDANQAAALIANRDFQNRVLQSPYASTYLKLAISNK